ncbi:MAG: hypothetical protein ACM3VS_01985 [Candidatus Dadabacteria bacterium]
MIERQTISGKDFWIKVEPYHVERANPNIIPTEYFTASYYTEEPKEGRKGEIIFDENGSQKLFESPVAAITHTTKLLEGMYSPIL